MTNYIKTNLRTSSIKINLTTYFIEINLVKKYIKNLFSGQIYKYLKMVTILVSK